jgi:hypothetical protein
VVAMKNAVFWNVTECGSPILVTLKMEVMHSSEMWFLTRATLCNITEYGILHSGYR